MDGADNADFNLPSLVLVPSHSLYFFSIFASRVCFALHIFKGKVALNIKDDGLGWWTKVVAALSWVNKICQLSKPSIRWFIFDTCLMYCLKTSTWSNVSETQDVCAELCLFYPPLLGEPSRRAERTDLTQCRWMSKQMTDFMTNSLPLPDFASLCHDFWKLEARCVRFEHFGVIL